MTNLDKCYESNRQAKEWLKSHNFGDIHMFPHTRFSKDLNFGNLKFDGICRNHHLVCLFQVKTNCKPTKAEIAEMIEFSKIYGVLALWFDRKAYQGVEVYPNGNDI